MRIPRTLDRPTRILGMPFDLVAIGIGIYYVFVMFEWGPIGIPIAIIGANIYARFRSNTLFRKIQRFIYWYLPAEFSKKSSVPGHIRKIKFSCEEKEKKDASNS